MKLQIEDGINNNILISGITDNVSANLPKILTFVEKLAYNKETILVNELLTESLNNYADIKNSLLLLVGNIATVMRLRTKLQSQLNHSQLEISLNAIEHNLSYFQNLCAKNVKTLVMVKAQSYGHGKNHIAHFLQALNTDYFAVALTDEAIDLRLSGIETPIMVMIPQIDGFEHLAKYNLEPVLYDFEILHSLNDYLIHNNILSFPVHIKLDTGMHRAGFMSNEMPLLSKILTQNSRLRVVSIFSHIASADYAPHDKYTHLQCADFNKWALFIEQQLGYPVIKHIAGTWAMQRFKDSHFDMVRLGIGLYNHSIFDNNTLKNVATLKSKITQLKKINAGQAVGYNRKWIVNSDATIATAPIGYADGLNRLLSNGNGNAYIKGMRVPIIGNICMDYCMLDVSGIEAKVGDEIIFFGEQITTSEIANKLNTISYEITTSISSRIKRIYIYEL